VCLVQDGGQYLVAVDESNDHVMSVWDWQKTDRGQRITDVKVPVMTLLCLTLISAVDVFCYR